MRQAVKVYLVVASFLIVVLVYLVAGPYVTTYKLNRAMEALDEEALSEHVDFPALQESIKNQAQILIEQEMLRAMGDNPLSAFGADLGRELVDDMVDAYITPAGLIYLVKLDRIANSIVQLDEEALSRYVDFPVLREDVKNRFRTLTEQGMLMLGAMGDILLFTLGAALVPLVNDHVDDIVDTYITPAGFIDLIGRVGIADSIAHKGGDEGAFSAMIFPNAEMSYESYSAFSVSLYEGSLRLILRRRGLDWKLSEIRVEI